MTLPQSERSLRVFLCHSSRDKAVVREVFMRLITVGWIDPWLDEEKLLPGQDWHVEIEKAVEVTDVVVVFLSNQSVSQEGFVQRELKLALDVADEKPEGAIFIIPLRLDDCPAPRRLRGWQYVDYFPEARKDWAYDRLYMSLLQRKRQQDIREIDKSGTIAETNNVAIIHPKVEKEQFSNTIQDGDDSKNVTPYLENLFTFGNSDKLQEPYPKEKNEAGQVVSEDKDTIGGGKVNNTRKRQSPKNVIPEEKTKEEIVVNPKKKNENKQAGPYNYQPETKKESLRTKKKVSEIENRECEFGGVKFVKIPSGKFLMGSDSINGAKPMRLFMIPHDYWIGIYPILNRQYNEFRKLKGKGDALIKSDHPVVNVSWFDALSYVNWFERMFRKELPKNYKIRLPSEAEWEKAARGTDGRVYPWGNKYLNYSNSNGNNSGTTAVGKYSPKGDSPYGVVDMTGNVWEWTRSTWRFLEDHNAELENYFSFERIVRGGSFRDDGVASSCPTRQYYPPATISLNIGFRIAISRIS